MRNKNLEPIWIMVLRIALALLFLFSGMTKTIDPINWELRWMSILTLLESPFCIRHHFI